MPPLEKRPSVDAPPSVKKKPLAEEKSFVEEKPSVGVEEKLLVGMAAFGEEKPSLGMAERPSTAPYVERRKVPGVMGPNKKVPGVMEPDKKKLSGGEICCSFFKKINFLDFAAPNPNGVVMFLVLVSLLYGLVAPWWMWCVASQPTAFVWNTSLLACSYFLIGTICFSNTTSPLTVFSRISCLTLVAIAAAYLIGQITGAAISCGISFYTAGIFGYAVGECFQHIGFEKSADILALRPLRSEEFEMRRAEWHFFICFIQGMISVCLLVCMVWMIFFPGAPVAENRMDEALSVINALSFGVLFLAWMWSSYMALVLLDGALVSFDTMFCKVLIAFLVSFLLNVVFLIVKWNGAALLVVWFLAMAMVGFLGYCLAVHAHYIRIRNQSVSSFFRKPKKSDRQPLQLKKVSGKED